MVNHKEDEYRIYGCEFKNEDDCQEEMDYAMKDYPDAESEHYDLEEQFSSNSQPPAERDEDQFEELKKAGLSEKEAAHIINAEKTQELKERDLMKKRRENQTP